MGSSMTNSEGICVQVNSEYVPGRSSPRDGHHFFMYRVVITNEGTRAAQLVSRHWIITNAQGRVQEVRGAGVVGQTPRIEPGQRFEYTSACPLDTSVGSMHGSYQMIRDDGTGFEARIEAFTLASPLSIN